MALSRDDLTIDKGNIGYGTMASLPEPGSAGDLAAEAATAGIVNTDASAELAQQVPNIVVPLNPEVRGDDQFITNEGSDSDRDVDTNINAGITTLDTGNIITKNRAISIGLSQIHPALGLAYTAYKYFNPGVDQSIVDAAETARLDDNPETQTYLTAVDSEENQPTPNYEPVTLDYNSSAQFANTNNTVGAYPEIRGDDETIAFEPEPTYTTAVDSEENQPTYTAPEPTYTAPAQTYTYYDGGSDSSGGYDSGDGGSYSGSSTEDYGGGEKDGGFIDGTNRRPMFSGGIARLRKNKQNTRIHDRRKRLAMGGITSLYG